MHALQRRCPERSSFRLSGTESLQLTLSEIIHHKFPVILNIGLKEHVSFPGDEVQDILELNSVGRQKFHYHDEALCFKFAFFTV